MSFMKKECHETRQTMGMSLDLSCFYVATGVCFCISDPCLSRDDADLLPFCKNLSFVTPVKAGVSVL